MQLRVSRETRNGTTYEYAQLVESYRRESDGMPVHRVVAHLGALSPVEIDNLRAALRAGREGKRVVVARPVSRHAVAHPRFLANLGYLDVAVLWELWKQWGLVELFDELMPRGETSVSSASVVAALSIQRCVDPGSTLYATRWFPRSALPELMALPPTGFHNTRLHRVLDQLDGASRGLMARLPRLYREREGAFVSLFVDVTDAWFVGHGPVLAEKGKTKEGLVERKIGIVLLCNERGYPLRWEVVPGAAHDSTTMTAMLQGVTGLSWAQGVPVVCDRAMGKTAQIRDLAATGLHFVTALTTSEFDSYTDRIPSGAMADIGAVAPRTQEDRVRETSRAAANAVQAGLTQVQDDQFMLDLGLVTHRERDPYSCAAQPAPVGTPAAALSLGRRLQELVDSGQYSSINTARHALGLNAGLATKYAVLCGLSEDIQREVLAGKAEDRSLNEMITLARLEDVDVQRERFAALLSTPVRKGQSSQRRRCRAGRLSGMEERRTEAPSPLQVHLIVYFNPRLCVEMRERANQRLQDIRSFVEQLNVGLANPRSRQNRQSVAAAVDRKLRGYELLDAFDLHIQEVEAEGKLRLSVDLKLKDKEWLRRRRHDGYTVLAVHPSIKESAERLCRLYREKDVVEKDFGTIKGLIELRPIRHRTDVKVRAHVTVCMLALLLERTLTQRLGGETTAEAALDELATCHLNRYQLAGRSPVLLDHCEHGAVGTRGDCGSREGIRSHSCEARQVDRRRGTTGLQVARESSPGR